MTKRDLLDRVSHAHDRANEARERLEADRWLAKNGSGTYGPRTSGRSLADRRTRPIREEYFTRIVGTGSCLGCAAGRLVFRQRPSGGTYYACSSGDGHLCYYIGFDSDAGVGYEMVVRSQRKAG